MATWDKAEMQYRAATLDRASVDVAARTVRLSFSSETPVLRGGAEEILDHSPESADFSRLNERAAFLVEHNPTDQVGAVEKAWLENRRGQAVVKFSRSKRADEIFQDVQDGIRLLVSVGYRVNDFQRSRNANGKEQIRATKWQPYHLSLVSDPADFSVGVGKRADATASSNASSNHTIKTAMTLQLNQDTSANGGNASQSTATAAASSNSVATAADGVRSERLRANEISLRASKFAAYADIQEMAKRAIEQGTSVEEFTREALEKMAKATPLQSATYTGPDASQTEQKQYTLMRALDRMARNKPVDGFEAEISDEIAKKVGRSPEGVFIPLNFRSNGYTGQRTMNVTTAADGGNLVATDLIAGSFIELLRAKSVMSRLGAIVLSDLRGNIAIPRQTGGATAYWLSEEATVTASTPQFGQLALTPHRLASNTVYSKNLLAQSSLAVENLVRAELMTTLALAQDLAALQGTGGDGEPEGIYEIDTGLSTGVTFAAPGTPTFAEMVSFETNVANSYADLGSLAYLVNPTARGKLKTTLTAANSGRYIFDSQGASGEGVVNGYRAVVTTQIPTLKNVCFGNWADVVLASWAGIDVVVNPYSLDLTGQVRVTITMLCDVGVRHAASFSISSNSVT